MDDVQLVPDGLHRVARGYGDLVSAADGVPDSVVPAGEFDLLLGAAEGDQLLAVVGPAHLAGGQAATCKVCDVIVLRHLLRYPRHRQVRDAIVLRTLVKVPTSYRTPLS